MDRVPNNNKNNHALSKITYLERFMFNAFHDCVKFIEAFNLFFCAFWSEKKEEFEMLKMRHCVLARVSFPDDNYCRQLSRVRVHNRG